MLLRRPPHPPFGHLLLKEKAGVRCKFVTVNYNLPVYRQSGDTPPGVSGGFAVQNHIAEGNHLRSAIGVSFPISGRFRAVNNRPYIAYARRRRGRVPRPTGKQECFRDFFRFLLTFLSVIQVYIHRPFGCAY